MMLIIPRKKMKPSGSFNWKSEEDESPALPLLHIYALFIAYSLYQFAVLLSPHSPVGSGKTALMLALCLALREKYSIAAVTNDIFTREDAEFLTKHKALPAPRIRAIETGGCPHAAVREDIPANLAALEDLHREFQTD